MTLREVTDAFPVGAATCEEYSLENEIRRTINTITLVNSRLLMLKAQDSERKYTFHSAISFSFAGKILLRFSMECMQYVHEVHCIGMLYMHHRKWWSQSTL